MQKTKAINLSETLNTKPIYKPFIAVGMQPRRNNRSVNSFVNNGGIILKKKKNGMFRWAWTGYRVKKNCGSMFNNESRYVGTMAAVFEVSSKLKYQINAVGFVFYLCDDYKF